MEFNYKNIKRVYFCLNCMLFIPIIPSINFYELEIGFYKKHRHHSIVIMTENEMFEYIKYRNMIKGVE